MSPAWRRWGAAALAAAALGFLGWTIAREWRQLRTHDWDVDGLQLAASVVGLIVVFGFGVWIWGRVLARLQPEGVRYRDLLRIWFLSSLARYVPGKIWQFVGAAGMARSAGVPGPVLLTSMVLHIGFTLLAAAVVSATVLFPARLVLEGAAMVLLVVLAAASILLVHPRVLNMGLRLVPRALHDEVIRWDGRWRDGLVLLALSVISWVGYGLVFTGFVNSLVAVPVSAVLPLIGANALAFLVGYVVFLAPAGLGAREAALAVLLAPYAPAGVAAVVALAARLWTIAAEVLGAALVTGVRAARGGRAPGTETETGRSGGGTQPER